MKMCLGGSFVDRPSKLEVRHPYDGSLVDTVPRAGPEDATEAVAAAVRGAREMARLTAHERGELLRRAADLVEARAPELARTITLEEGKVLAEARAEVARTVQTIRLSSEEARRLHGETVPLDAAPGVSSKLGFTLRVPCGVVVAIGPFNFPLNLTAHKVAPALAAGNAVIVKPPSSTPLSALKLTEILLEAGAPPEALSCLPGPGATLGEALCADERVRKITFTGSVPVGRRICHVAGLKKVTMELGSNSPIVVLGDADLELAATAIAATAFSNAGQVCISAQRVIAERLIYAELLERARPKVEALVAGDPRDERTQVGPLITEAEAARVEEWIAEAVRGGARVLAGGGGRRGAVLAPTLVADVRPEMRLSREELFGPAVACTPVEGVEEALALANDSRFGLAASVFTESVDHAMRFAQRLEAGSVHINWGPQWRADLMPYGGLKESGFGKEGPSYAVLEMTELKMVCFHLRPAP
jgi:acyl-CoA reductase-like NAD-dependent aldehyde dehydrogenase